MDVVQTQRRMARRRDTPSFLDESPSAAVASSRNPIKRFRRFRSRSAPASTRKRHPLIEDHYRVDSEKRQVLPGLPKHDDDWKRDTHDFFNLVILVPVVVLNVMNWNWDKLFDLSTGFSVEDAWTGEFFEPFLNITVSYFIIDLLWVSIVPSCVKSPGTIIQHHIATLLYILIPYLRPQYRWAMGACMSVEINTWFLIARRVFNKQGFTPWVIDLPPFMSIRIKLISIFFYLSWISIRVILFPVLMLKFITLWWNLSLDVGTKFNILFPVFFLHSTFCLLNLKWTYDLVRSKIRYWRRGGKGPAVQKGL